MGPWKKGLQVCHFIIRCNDIGKQIVHTDYVLHMVRALLRQLCIVGSVRVSGEKARRSCLQKSLQQREKSLFLLWLHLPVLDEISYPMCLLKQLRVIRGSRTHLDIFLDIFVFPDTTFYRLGILKHTNTTTCFFSTETSLDH